MRDRLLRLFLLAFGSAAVAAPAWAELSPQITPPEGQATVYMLRPSIDGGAITSSFFIDNVKVLSMPMRGCTALTLPAGRHEVKFKFGPIFPDTDSVTTEMEAGSSYYYSQYTWFSPGFTRSEMRLHQSTLSDIEAALKHCRPVAPINLDKISGASPITKEEPVAKEAPGK